MKTADEHFMSLALRLAKKSAAEGEVPVGCVIVRNGVVIARGRNRREINGSALAHAEIEAIGRACKKLGGWRLFDCDLYVTLEPCPMCAGAIINARIARVFYGTPDPKAGACGSVINLFGYDFNHRPELTFDVLREQCSGVLTEFFSNLREQKNKRNSKSYTGDM